ncbi:DUF6671 family protein [Flavobacterium aurantiibacter]|uniref:DUF6671 domain-containing protein n=1 Tax=Flavobacterium aurantiibacter TaxID=2023067 RepID=A0A255ZVU4_9FLAO|nr:DUF6671 family protein [Flavobacterium aurantiibacter]OYQ45522.1 hypothetical protein CHX27_06000 [Flavobacterium aurantiibacter]
MERSKFLLGEGRTALFATKHGKGLLVQSLFNDQLGIQVQVAPEFDTDVFGTFSGEVNRRDSALETVRRKAKAAAEKYGHDLILASEGSFGPHPEIFFAHANEEYLLLADYKNKREYLAKHLTTDTNFSGERLTNLTDLATFLQKVGFPEAKVILKNREENPDVVSKDLASEEEVATAAQDLLNRFGSFYVETDMRAMNNPLRRKAIAETAQKLIEKIKSLCPNCAAPGFDWYDVKTGLPCELCQQPTNSVLALKHRCEVCQFENEQPRPDNKSFESAMYCNYCNP